MKACASSAAPDAAEPHTGHASARYHTVVRPSHDSVRLAWRWSLLRAWPGHRTRGNLKVYVRVAASTDVVGVAVAVAVVAAVAAAAGSAEGVGLVRFAVKVVVGICRWLPGRVVVVVPWDVVDVGHHVQDRYHWA